MKGHKNNMPVETCLCLSTHMEPYRVMNEALGQMGEMARGSILHHALGWHVSTGACENFNVFPFVVGLIWDFKQKYWLF